MPCRTASRQIAASGSVSALSNGAWQQPGSLLLTVLGPPNDHAVLVVGLTDFGFGAFPFPLPGGCHLDVSPDAIVLRLLGSAGASGQTIVIPPGPAFLGVRLFNQWLHLDATGISTSEAAIHRIGV